MEGDTMYIYIIQLGSPKAKNECEAVEINNTPEDVLNWIEGNFHSDAEYFDCELIWRWVTLYENMFYACIVESEYFDEVVDGFDTELTLKDIIKENFDIVSDLICII